MAGTGVAGSSSGASGVTGESVAASGLTGFVAGVLGDSSTNDGVVGLSSGGNAISGYSTRYAGVRGPPRPTARRVPWASMPARRAASACRVVSTAGYSVRATGGLAPLYLVPGSTTGALPEWDCPPAR